MSTPIYTIGYGNRNIEDFINFLKKNDINYLVDVRSKPSSRFNPSFSQDAVIARLRRAGIRYVFMGDTIGGLPADRSCYTDDRVDYNKIKTKDFYKAGIKRIRIAWDKNLRIVLMCSETKPEDCHRSKLLGDTLTKMGIEVVHFDEHYKERSQEDVMDRIVGGQLSLFDNVFMSRKKYAK